MAGSPIYQLTAALEELCVQANHVWKDNRPSHLNCHVLQYENGAAMTEAAGNKSVPVLGGVVTGWLCADPVIQSHYRICALSWFLLFDPDRPAIAHFHGMRPKLLKAIGEELLHGVGHDAGPLLGRHDSGIELYSCHVTFAPAHPLQPSARLERLARGLCGGPKPKAWPAEIDL